MPRYIDADKLIEEINDVYPHIEAAAIKMRISTMPTADVVEVVRCKDCKYSREQDKVFEITDYKCVKHNISCLSPCDFCSYGEREEAKGDG